jgi:hypothetical protein
MHLIHLKKEKERKHKSNASLKHETFICYCVSSSERTLTALMTNAALF